MKSIKTNLLYSIFYQILTLVLPLVTIPYLSRVLGADGIGRFSYSNSIAYYFSIFAILGLNNYGNRTIAKVRDDKCKLSKTFWNIYAMQIMFALIALVVYLLFVSINKDQLLWIQTITVMASLFDINWFFFGLEEFKITVTRNTFIKIFSLALIFAFVKSSKDVWIYTLIMASSSFFSCLILLLFLKDRIIYVKPEFKEIKKHIKPNLILFIPVISVSLYKVMDKIMLGYLSEMIEVGYYENTERVLNIPISIVTALGTVMLPRISNLAHKNNLEECSKYFKYSILFVVCMSAAISFGLMSISKPFIQLFFGSGFEKCNYLFYILLPSTIFIAFANVVRTQYLIPYQKDSVYIKSVILGAIINLSINLILIPKYNSIGAAIGTLLAEASVCVYQSFAIRNEIEIKKLTKYSLPFLFNGGMMFLVLRYIPIMNNIILDLIIKVVVGSIIFITLTAIYLITLKKKKIV